MDGSGAHALRPASRQGGALYLPGDGGLLAHGMFSSATKGAQLALRLGLPWLAAALVVSWLGVRVARCLAVVDQLR